MCVLSFLQRRIAQISNVHLFSRQLSSGQSFAALLLVLYSMPAFHLRLKGYPLLVAAKVEEPGAPILTH